MITATTDGAAAPRPVTEAMVEAAHEASRRHRPELDRLDIIEILEAGLAAEAAWVPEERDLLSGADADLSRPGTPPKGPRWRHVKRGTVYEEVCRAELQVSTTLPVEGRTIVVYRGEDWRLWARDRYEFEDGRFERIAGRQAPDSRAGVQAEPQWVDYASGRWADADLDRLQGALGTPQPTTPPAEVLPPIKAIWGPASRPDKIIDGAPVASAPAPSSDAMPRKASQDEWDQAVQQDIDAGIWSDEAMLADARARKRGPMYRLLAALEEIATLDRSQDEMRDIAHAALATTGREGT